MIFASSCLGHDPDFMGSPDVDGHVTIWYPSSHLLWVLYCDQVCISRSFRDISPETFPLTFQGYVMLSVTCPVNSSYAVSYQRSIGTEPLSISGCWGIKWSHDQWRHVTPKSQGRGSKPPLLANPRDLNPLWKIIWLHTLISHLHIVCWVWDFYWASMKNKGCLLQSPLC